MSEKFVQKMPVMSPLPLKTNGKNGFWVWISQTRRWILEEDFYVELPDESIAVIPKGFIHDGASIPKMFRAILSPVGIMLIAGIVHDYLYKYRTVPMVDGYPVIVRCSQKYADEMFLSLNNKINGMGFINKVAWMSLRAAGSLAWKKHRKNERGFKPEPKMTQGTGDMY